MEVVTVLIQCLLISSTGAMYYTRGRIPSLQCTQYSFCTERDRDRWLEKRRSYKILLRLKNEVFQEISKLSVSALSVNRWRNYFCHEYQSVAFLMENDSERWQITCLWSGNDINATCAPAPPNTKPISYIERQKWRQMLNVCDANRDILCTDSLTCSEHHRILWFRMRKHVKNILNFMNYNGYEYQKRRLQYDDPSIYSLKMRYMLCREVQSVGFMIDSQSDQWPIRCLWNGNAMNGTCAPGPPSNLSVFYITPKEWQQKVKEFRIKIGCSGKDIENANKVCRYDIVLRMKN
uniref:Uncharacterized protein n=1 Tax=Setaria digitata TaxID=48799 RepID=A0A915PPX3_9BILA